MLPLKTRGGKQPESRLQEEIENFLRLRGWYTKKMVGSMMQAGFPDIFATHRMYGVRLIEVKMPNRRGDMFTPAQHKEFPKIAQNGCGIWIMTAATEEEYKKLFGPYNWYKYLEAFPK